MIKKGREEVYAGVSFKWFTIITIWACGSVVGFVPYTFLDMIAANYLTFLNWSPESLANLVMVAKCAIVALELVLWGIYAKHFRTVDQFDETLLKLSFMWDQYCGLHTTSPYNMKVKFLEMKFPLRDVHKHGLIEFTQKRYGVLIGYIAPQVNPQDKSIHDLNIQKLLDRLTGDMMISFITASRHSMRGPIIRKITKRMNEKNVPKHIYKYLDSMYNHVKNNDKLTPTWDFYIFLGLGKHDTLDDAYSSLNSELPGIMDALENASMIATVFKDPKEIAQQYRQFCIPERLNAGVYH